MTHAWIDALVRPSRLLREASSPEERAIYAVSLLIEGRLDQHAALAREESRRHERADPVWTTGQVDVLTRGLSLLREGNAEALQLLASAAASQDSPDIAFVAAVLLNMGLSDAGRPDMALAALITHRRLARTYPQKALLQIHTGLRQAELGNAKAALAAMKDAVRRSSRRKDENSRTLGIVAAHNELHLAFAAHEPVPAEIPLVSNSVTLAWIDGVAGEGLSSYLDEHFKTFFDDPYSRTISFRTADTVDQAILQALLRAEAVGYHQGLMHLRKSLGQYRLLSTVGAPGRGATSGFALLRRAADSDSLRRSISVFRASGPLEVLKAVGEAACATSWLPPELRGDFVLISGSAFTFSQETASAAFDRLLPAIDELIGRLQWNAWITKEVFDAVAALVPRVDEARANAASAALRRLAELPPDALLHQSMSGAIRALGWERLSRRERDAWRAYVSAHLSRRDDHIFPARAAAIALIETGYPKARLEAIQAYRESRSLLLAPLLLAATRLARADGRMLAEDVVTAAQDYRRSAADGKFTFGGISVGALLGQATIRLRLRALGDELLTFLLDPAIPAEERALAARPIVEQPKRIPRSLRLKLANGLPMSTVSVPLLGGDAQFRAMSLRLRLAFGHLAPAEALSTVIELAGSGDVEERTLAIETTVALRHTLQAGAVAAILLSLSHDAVPAVRGYAGRALASVAFSETPLEQARLERVEALTAEPGETVPALVWGGIAAARGQAPLPRVFIELASQAADHHIASTVRAAARRALEVADPPRPAR